MTLSANSGSINRRARMSEYLQKMARVYDVIFIQEAKLLARETDYLKTDLPGCKIFYDNNPRNKGMGLPTAGTITIISKRWNKDYELSQIRLPMVIKGHCCAVRLRARDPGSRNDLLLVNAYFYGGKEGKIERQVKQLKALKKQLPGGLITFLGGDMNFVVDKEEEDTQGLAPARLRRAWEKLESYLGLTEAYQPLATYYHVPLASVQAPTQGVSAPGKGVAHNTRLPTCRRLDRFYHNLSQAELAVVTPTASLLTRPILSDDGHKLASDHLPIALRIIPTAAPGKRAFPNIPKHVAEHPSFRKAFITRWFRQEVGVRGPVERWGLLCRCLSQAGKEVARHARPQHDTLATVNALIKVIRSVKIPSQRENIMKIIREHNLPLPSTLPDNSIDPRPFIGTLNELFSKHGELESSDDRLGVGDSLTEGFCLPAPAISPPSSKTGVNFVKKAKLFLPSSRKRVKALRGDIASLPTKDPAAMGKLIKSFGEGFGEKCLATEKGSGGS
jgi:hypothetical protein